jgi:hypothetical protein
MKALLVLAVALGVQTLAAQQDPRAKFLTDRGCHDCHAIAALKVKAKADVAPDLSAAYVDVPFRYGMTLERFLDQPQSVMRIVLGGRPPLEPAERDSLVALFRNLYAEHLAKLDSAQRRTRPVETKRSREDLW